MLNRTEFGFCPLTKQVFRHPVLASDGYHYELIALSEYLLINQFLSPITHEKITQVHYDLMLKTSIDETHHENQFQEYEKNELMNHLINTLAQPYLPWKQALYQSNNTALLGLSLLTAAKVYLGSDVSSFFVLSTLLSMGLADFSFRMLTRHQNGFFGTISRTIQTDAFSCPNIEDELGPI